MIDINNKIGIKGLIKAWICENGIYTPIHEKNYLSYKKNLQPNGYITDIVNSALYSPVDLRFKHVALSTKFDTPTKSDTLVNEIGRVVPSSITKVGNKIIVESTFSGTDANTLTTSITAFSDRQTLTLSSVTGLQVNDGVQITLPNGAKEERKITAISTLTITLDKVLSADPSIVTTGNIKQLICRIHLVYGTSSTLTLNSGYGASIASLNLTKTSTQIIYTRHELEFLGS